MSLKHGLLGLLHSRPMTGYDLTKIFNESLNFFWHAQMSQIYRDLGTLEKKGFVESEIEEQHGKPDKKIYSITPKGNEEFKKWLDDCDFSDSIKYRDAAVMKIFFGSMGDRKKFISGLEDFIFLNEEHLISYKRSLKMFNNDKQKIGEMFDSNIPQDKFLENITYMKMTITKGLITAKANIEWAEECIKTLQEL